MLKSNIRYGNVLNGVHGAIRVVCRLETATGQPFDQLQLALAGTGSQLGARAGGAFPRRVDERGLMAAEARHAAGARG